MCVCLLGRTISWYALAYSLPRIPNNPFSFPASAGQKKFLFSSLILKQKRLFQRKKMFPSQGYREKVTENMRGVACFFGQQKGRGRFQLSSGCSEFLLPLRSFSKHSQEYDTDARGTNFSQLPNHPTLEGAPFLSSDASRPHSTSALRRR